MTSNCFRRSDESDAKCSSEIKSGYFTLKQFSIFHNSYHVLRHKITIHDKLSIYGKMLLIKAVAKEDTILRTQMFPCLLSRATCIADTKFASVTEKCF